MPIGALVAVPELAAEGPARLESVKTGWMGIRFLATGAAMTIEEGKVQRHALMPGTTLRVRGEGGDRTVTITGGLGRDPASGLLVYPVSDDGGTPASGAAAVWSLREDAIIAVPLPSDPVEQLATVAFHDLCPRFGRAGSRQPPEPASPVASQAREDLLAWRDAAWSTTAGVAALAGARVRPLPHQLIAARRVLADRQVRFLLADEVGLGKTIEAGLVMQSLLALKPGLRALVVAPGALLSQWFLELYVRFGGRSFTMLDQDRLDGWEGDAWTAQPFVLASSRAVEGLVGPQALQFAKARWDLLVVDECHRMRPGGALYKRIAILSRSTPHVLLLSATPARQHADAYLGLLALLEPSRWRLDDLPAFTAKLAAHDRVVALAVRTADAGSDVSALAEDWRRTLPGDQRLAALATALVGGDANARTALLAHVHANHPFDHRIIRQRRQALARLSTATGVASASAATRSGEVLAYSADDAERAVRTALALYRSALAARFRSGAVTSQAAGHGAAPSAPDQEGAERHDDPGQETAWPPRLAHWLLQLELGAGSTPHTLDRLLAMRAAVVADPAGFDSYRRRAPSGETLTQVLRSDLSEGEVATHLAISAACHVDPAVETAALAALRTAVAAWAKSAARGPARTLALLARLRRFWKDQPQEKVLVFTAHSLAVEELAAALRRPLGEDAVETFGAHQDTVAREAASMRFRDDDDCTVLVCDPLGGEGRNFQFVSVVAHHDLPWSVAAVEQRIGRVDRIGRDGDVPSWVLAESAADGIESAWAAVLTESVDVFARSSSGLEFAADAIETRALVAALDGGGAALRALIPELTALVAHERGAGDRREDDAFAGDVATFATAAQQAAAVGMATPPVAALARWLRAMGGSAHRDDDHPRPWRLRARTSEQADSGVFDRESALARPDLAFFAVGNALIDRVLDDAAGAAWCRATAWRRLAGGGVTAWEGLRASLVLAYDVAALATAGVPLTAMRRLLLVAPPQRRTVFVRADGSAETGAVALALLTPPFDARTDRVLSQQASRDHWVRPLLAGDTAQVVRWQHTIRTAGVGVGRLAAAALTDDRAQALAALDSLLTGADAVLAAAAATAVSILGPDHADSLRLDGELTDERRQATVLRAAVAGAQWTIESLAYVLVA